MIVRKPGLVLVLIVLLSAQIEAQSALFKPFTSFRVIQTERFDIIFPKESESSARLLASYADRVYDQVSTLLGIEYPGRIPVTFTPHTDQFNGYYQSMPSSHIMLYDTAMDIEWTSFANNLEALFTHELTHAVSLSTRSPCSRVLHFIFGNWVTPSWLSTPGFMLEGVTVSFESLDGTGRANDPLIKQKLRQAIHEGKFLTPLQASGLYDLPGQESMIYEYGGPFSAWLQQEYGMEKYAELWQKMGSLSIVTFSVYKSDFYRMFKAVYALDFLDAWNAFRDSLALSALETNSDTLLPVKKSFFSEKPEFIRTITTGGKSLYFLDRLKSNVSVYDTVTGKTQTFNTGPYSLEDIDVNAENTLFLVSGYRFPVANRATAVVNEYRTDTGRSTGRSIKGLFRARYFRDGVIGIRSDLHNTNIVYEDFNGNCEILLRGSETLMFSGPQVLDNERIVFIAARNGIRELWLYNYSSRELFRIENIEGGNDEWAYMRSLGVSEGKLLFSYNSDDRMYKLASVDLDTMQATFSKRDFSGGVSSPVSLDGMVYYNGSFFSRDSLLRFPEPTDSFSGTRSTVHFVKLDTAMYETSSLPEELPFDGASKPYFSLRYMNPLDFWLPLPLLRFGGSLSDISLDGGGIFTLISDPINRNMLTIIAYADIPFRMARVEQFSWVNTTLGIPLQLDFIDQVDESWNVVFRRYTSISLSGSSQWTVGRWVQGFSLGGGYIRVANDNGKKSAYEWEKTESLFYLASGFSLSNRRRQYRDIFGTGLYFNLEAISLIESFQPRIDGILKASVETRFPLELTLFGAYDHRGMNLRGTSYNYGERSINDLTMKEYSNTDSSELSWLAGGEVAVGLASFEIQGNLSHLYFNRIFSTLSVRNVLYDGKNQPDAEGVGIYDLRLIQSLRLKLSIKTSILPIIKTPISFEPYIIGAWKFSNAITGKNFADQIGFDAGFSLSY